MQKNLNIFLSIFKCAFLSLSLVLSSCGGGGGGAPSTSPAVPDVLPSSGTIYHVRSDGGDAAQCTGKVNAKYPGTGSAQDCAWISPMVALPHQGAIRMAGGDTLLIHTGQYKVGFGAPTGTDGCSKDFPWDCIMQDVPSGLDATHPTQILGEGYSTGCSQAPQLWGTERVHHVLGLSNAQHVKVTCLEVTDHAPCVQFHSQPSTACKRDVYPYGDWAVQGLYAVDSSHVELTDVNIHGLSNAGITAGRIKDWTLTRVRIAANGWVGWDGDVGASTSSNSGTIQFSHVTIEWNGCAETYGSGTPAPTACWAQTAGGYGDGLGTASTGGNWVIEDSVFLHNTSDGLDLLYADATGLITLNRVRSEGNAGNQIKAAGPVNISNTIAIGNCNFFDSKTFTYNVDPCRAGGDIVAINARTSSAVGTINNSTLIGEGNVAVYGTGPSGSTLKLQNNILIGVPGFFVLADTFTDGVITVLEDGNLKQNLRSANCTAPHAICGNAGLVNDTFDAFDPHLLSTSAARDSGVTGPLLSVPDSDFFGHVRASGSGIDRGAIEFP